MLEKLKYFIYKKADQTILPFYFLGIVFFGFAFLFIIPPFNGADESAHFAKVLALVHGKSWFGVRHSNNMLFFPAEYENFHLDYRCPTADSRREQSESSVPSCTFSKVWGWLQHQPLSGKKVFIHGWAAAASYPPLVYLFYLPVGFLAKWLLISDGMTFFLGRLFGLLGNALLTLWALSLVKKNKAVLAALVFMPNYLGQMAIYSGDGLTNALALLNFSVLVRLLEEPETPLTLNEKRAAFVSMLLGVCKFSYFLVPLPLIFSFFFLSQETKKLKQRLLLTWILFAVIGILYACFGGGMDVGVVTSHREQLLHIVFHPLSFLQAVWKTVQAEMFFISASLLSWRGFGYYSASPWWLQVLAGVFLFSHLVSLKLGKLTAGFLVKMKALSLAVCVVNFLFIYMILYMNWNSLSAPLISGVQGRYFYPFLPLLSIFFAHHFPVCFQFSVPFFVVSSVSMLVCSLIFLARQFYGVF